MSDFSIYFQLGWQHILDLNGYDHILFVMVLCCSYVLKDWKKILWLVTAFTLGHSLTLALAAFKILNVNTAWIEFLIPITILITAIYNLPKRRKQRNPALLYTMTLAFGLIHGLGFSNYLQSLLGKEANIFLPLLSFNIGLEFGQLIIVFFVILLSELMLKIFSVTNRDWSFFISSAVIGISFIMALERIPV
ncbi:HupE/UreJ family protein [Sphingobacterium sp. DK4209]|uniref:HupE/UreJ family protein n=1 Tax=Sphingobacterium zhuxiongii TaxID=2662364 RepID=A0A5Q0Q9Q6_9SPHI|nr:MULTISPECIES: HupE/UreJ family protein [unclassified Sphingobacterium]MVZ64550.1 HupE/UreJ family protein [Sphingobacterium sp. DK4209]QGA25879.1 HupE/UreJ family protein [Sphingobacterium sp. dk4302]